MSRPWLGLGVTGIVAGVLVAGVATSIGVIGAPEKTATAVEVVNFPEVQGVEVVNPSVAVTGEISVGNLPIDSAGNLRVADQAGAQPGTHEMSFSFLESDRPNILYSPDVQVPAGYSRVSLAFMSLSYDAQVRSFSTEFGTETGLPSGKMFVPSFPIEDRIPSPYGGASVLPGVRATYFVGGATLRIAFEARDPVTNSNIVPPDSEYLLILYFSK